MDTFSSEIFLRNCLQYGKLISTTGLFISKISISQKILNNYWSQKYKGLKVGKVVGPGLGRVQVCSLLMWWCAAPSLNSSIPFWPVLSFLKISARAGEMKIYILLMLGIECVFFFFFLFPTHHQVEANLLQSLNSRYCKFTSVEVLLFVSLWSEC